MGLDGKFITGSGFLMDGGVALVQRAAHGHHVA
jgi:hypothetical protein